MTHIPLNLAVEDEISDYVLRRILQDIEGITVGTIYRRGGSGYLRKTISGWNNAAKGIPFAVLTDLDRYVCPAELINDWLTIPKHPNLLFRIAVREVEAWLLADQAAMASFLGISVDSLPRRPDDLQDPKSVLVELAKRSRRSLIRESLVPRRGSTAKQGPGYNGCLAWYVKTEWMPEVARLSSPSLDRTLQRFASFRPHW
jgi:hypothetical protein